MIHFCKTIGEFDPEGVQQTIKFSYRAYCEGCFNFVMIHANVGEIAQCDVCEEYRMVEKYAKSVFDTTYSCRYGLRGPRVDL
jgi:hypothetical protein